MTRALAALALLTLFVSSCDEATDEPDPNASGEVLVEGEHVLDFRGSIGGSLSIGDMYNLAFAIEDTTPRTFVADTPSPLRAPDIAVTYDKVRCEMPGVLEINAAFIDRIHSANVDLVSLQVTGEGSVSPEAGGVCFGYRTVGGGWTWDLTPIAWTQDAEAGGYRVDLPVHAKRVDGVKLMSITPVHLATVRYTTF